MSGAVKELLHAIETLDEEDRLVLERTLASRFQREWTKETFKAQKIAKRRKIDQAKIDRVIERRRYGG